MALVAAFFVGALFVVGLAFGGMLQPQKIVAFLDVTGDWDPSLAFVLGGAVTTYFVAFRLIRRREAPVFDKRFRVPTSRDITGRLVVGAAIFGAGWGLAGWCPGPALASLPTLSLPVAAFVVAMFAGLVLAARFDRSLDSGWLSRLSKRPSSHGPSTQPQPS